MSTHAIGIDLGTSYFRIGVVHQGKVKIIRNEQDQGRTPNIVAFTENGSLVGEPAKCQASANSKNTVFNVKRLIGRDFRDQKVQSELKLSPFDIADKENRPHILVEPKGEKKYLHPVEVSSIILTKAKETAEAYLGKPVQGAVLGVPACFNKDQRKATKVACEKAGLSFLRFVDEPHAAAIAYSLEKNARTKENILIFDLGGGSLSLAIVEFDCGTIEVKATGGDDHLGGEDFTNKLVENFVQEFKKKHNMDISCSKNAIYRLRAACERVKIALSTSNQANIALDSLFKGIDFYSSITRYKFEKICTGLFNSTLNEVKKLLSDAKFDKDKINEIIVIGESSRIPKIRKLLREFFNREKPFTSKTKDEAVASGAAILAAKLIGDKSEVSGSVVLREFTPLSIGIGSGSGNFKILIERGTPVPTECSKYFVTTDHEQTEIINSFYEGEEVRSSRNDHLCQVKLSGLASAPRGKTFLGITIEIDVNGILHLSAAEKDKMPRNETKVVITDYLGRLSRKEIEGRVRSAQIHKASDEKRSEASNKLETYCDDQMEALKSEQFKKKFSAKKLEELKKKVVETQEWLGEKPQVEIEEFVRKENELKRLFVEGVSEIDIPSANGGPRGENTVSSTAGRVKFEPNETGIGEETSRFESEVRRAGKRQKIMQIMSALDSFHTTTKRVLEELLDD